MNKRGHGLKVFRQNVFGLKQFGLNICGPKYCGRNILDVNHTGLKCVWTKVMWTKNCWTNGFWTKWHWTKCYWTKCVWTNSTTPSRKPLCNDFWHQHCSFSNQRSKEKAIHFVVANLTWCVSKMSIVIIMILLAQKYKLQLLFSLRSNLFTSNFLRFFCHGLKKYHHPNFG